MSPRAHRSLLVVALVSVLPLVGCATDNPDSTVNPSAASSQQGPGDDYYGADGRILKPKSQELQLMQFEAIANWAPENGAPGYVQDNEHNGGMPTGYAQIQRSWILSDNASAASAFKTAVGIADATGWKQETTTDVDGEQTLIATKCLNKTSATLNLVSGQGPEGEPMIWLTMDESAALSETPPTC